MFKQEIYNLNTINQNETRVRNDYQKEVERLSILLNERTEQYNKCSLELNKLMKDSNLIYSNNERLKDEIISLKEQNQRVRQLI